MPAAQQRDDDLGELGGADRMSDHRVRQRPARQPAVVPTGDQQDGGRGVGDLVLDLPGQAHTPAGGGLGVQDADVGFPVVDRVDHGRAVRGVQELQDAEFAVGKRADGELHPLPDFGLVRVHENGTHATAGLSLEAAVGRMAPDGSVEESHTATAAVCAHGGCAPMA